MSTTDIIQAEFLCPLSGSVSPSLDAAFLPQAELMLKDQPVFCNCLKILTAEGLPESHFYLQFPSSGLSAIKNLKEPQRAEQSAHIQVTTSNQGASGNHGLYLLVTRR